MKPGPPPKPTRLRVLESNPSKRPLYANEPMPRQRAPDKPDDLSPVASEEWDRIVPELDRLGILSPLDRTMLVVYCEAVEIYTLALAKVRESGVLIKGARGSERVKNPALQIVRDFASMIRVFGSDLGLTPSARARMSLPNHRRSIEDLLAFPDPPTPPGDPVPLT